MLKIFRRKVVARDLNVSDSALRRQLGRGNLSVAVLSVGRHRLGFVRVARHRLRAGLAAKLEAKVRALVNPAGRRKVEYLLQVSAGQGSQRVERRSQRKRRHHQGHNKF